MKIKTIGHRGASSLAPENTLISFEKAFALGCDGIEFDVQQTADGQIVVIHDWTLERTTNGKGLVREHRLAQLKELDAGSWFKTDNSEFQNSQIPTLQEVLDIVPKAGSKLINIEIKELFSQERGTEQKVLEIVQQSPLRQNIVVSSFSHNLLLNIKKLDFQINIGLLMASTIINLPQYIQQLGFDIYSFHPNVSLLRQEEISWAKEQEILVYPWTVNQSMELKQCQSLGVDGVMSNYPNILAKYN